LPRGAIGKQRALPAEVRQTMKILDKRSLLAVVVIGALLTVAFWNTLAWLAEAWWSDVYYSHGPLVLLISAFLVWSSRGAVRRAPEGPNPLGIAVLALGLLLHAGAVLWRAYYLSAFGLLAVLAGLGLLFLGRQAMGRLLFPLVFLAFSIPLPLAERLGPPLEVFTATQATNLVRLAGIPAINEGSRVILTGSTFAVGAPCSGLSSLVALIALAALLAYAVQGPGWARWLVFLSAVPVALLANLVRVATLFGVAHVWGPDVALGYYHDFSSPVLFLVALVLLILLSRGLGCGDFNLERSS
jgi:exosortase